MSKKKLDPRKQAQAAAKRAEAAAKKAIVTARAKFKAAEKAVNKHIKNDPEKAVLIAAGIGAAIGAITMLALKRKK
ncbi:MAG: hypothetical protein WC350_00395 [Candidatus Micrarchaeia archaeon]